MFDIAAPLRRLRRTFRATREIEAIKLNQGIALAAINRGRVTRSINDHEFSVFSQWGEDGIIQHLIDTLDIPNKTFIEFGVEDFSESNCRFLMMKDHWHGFIVDGSAEFARSIRRSNYYWRYRLDVHTAFVDAENIADILARSGFGLEPGILSVDIDGVDWWVLKALEAYRAAIVIVEYNALFGSVAEVTVPYDPQFRRSTAHHSNKYYGASLGGFTRLLEARGYALVAGNLAGSNAFYVRRDLLNDCISEQSVTTAWRPPSFREARDRTGALTFAAPREALADIAALPLLDLASERMITIRDLPPLPGNFC